MAAESIRLEDQLATLQGYGIRPGPHAIAYLLSQWPRERYEQEPYTLLLTTEDWSPQVTNFGDLEFLDSVEDYVPALERLAQWTGQRARLGSVAAEIDGDSVTINYTVDGRQLSITADYAGDYADGMALAEIARDLAAHGWDVTAAFVTGVFVLIHVPAEQFSAMDAFLGTLPAG